MLSLAHQLTLFSARYSGVLWLTGFYCPFVYKEVGMSFTRGYRASLPFGLLPLVPGIIRSTIGHGLQSAVRVNAVPGSELVRDRRPRSTQGDTSLQPFYLSLSNAFDDLAYENMRGLCMAEKEYRANYVLADKMDMSRGLIV